MNLFASLLLSWQFWAFLSAVAAALTAIFAKLGVKGIPPDVATFVRTIVILMFVSAMLYFTDQLAIVNEHPRDCSAVSSLTEKGPGGFAG